MREEIVNKFYSRGIHKIATVWDDYRYDLEKQKSMREQPNSL